MKINENLDDYKNSIEHALAGFLANKSVQELTNFELEVAKGIVSKMSMEKYFTLADALDREDYAVVSNLITDYNHSRPIMGESIKPIDESGYMDADLFLREGFTYFGVFEDEKLRNSVAKYLDENEVEYMDCGDGHIQMKFSDRERAYRAEAAISRMVAKNNPHYVRDDINIDTSITKNFNYAQDGGDFYDANTGKHIISAPFKVSDYDLKAAIAARKWFEEKYPNATESDFDDYDIDEDRKPFPDPGLKYRKAGKQRHLVSKTRAMKKLEKKNNSGNCFKEEDTIKETPMPAGVIKAKKRYENMSDEEFAKRFSDKTADELRSMAWRHGYGKMSDHYLKRVQRVKQVEEGYTSRELTDYDKEWLSRKIPGLEGPFRNQADGKYYYYDPKEGRWYDPTSDFYMDRDFQLESVSEAKKGTKVYGKKPYNVRSGGPIQPQSGAGAHTEPTKAREIAKREKKHKNGYKKYIDDSKNLEELKMSKTKVDEGVMGMIDIPSINRMRRLAGMDPIQEASKNVEKEELDEALPVPMDDSPMMVDPIDEMPSDEMGDIESSMSDEMGDDVASPMDDEVSDTAMDMTPDMDAPVTDVAMDEPVVDMGDVRSEIESSIETMLAKAPDLKITDYKDVLSRAEDAVAQMRAMGSQYLKEGKENETLKDWVGRQGGFKKSLIKEQMFGQKKR